MLCRRKNLSLNSTQWFFSTCAQTFGAMVGVFGMFIVYRLQSIRAQIEDILERLRSHDPQPPIWRRQPEDKLIEHATNKAGSYRSAGQAHDAEPLDELIRRYQSAIVLRNRIRAATLVPTAILLSLIGGSIFLLWLFSCIGVPTDSEPYRFQCVRGVSAFIVTVLAVFPLCQIGKVIWISVREV